MAGYYLASLDWGEVSTFLESPSDKQIQRIVKSLLKQWKNEEHLWDEDGIMKDWPKKPDELEAVVREHFAKDDWYTELNSEGYYASQASCWEMALSSVFDKDKSLKLKHLVDPVYWNVVEQVEKHHKTNGTSCVEFSCFGKRPLRYVVPDEIGMDEWYPTHSMHTPDEVKLMAEQCFAAKPSMGESKHEEVPGEYNRLSKAFEMLLKSERVLFVTIDT